MEVRLILNDDYGQRNGGKAGVSKATDLTKDALTMFQWAIEEAAKGRVVLSSDSTGGDIHRLAMPSLNRAQKLASSS